MYFGMYYVFEPLFHGVVSAAEFAAFEAPDVVVVEAGGPACGARLPFKP